MVTNWAFRYKHRHKNQKETLDRLFASCYWLPLQSDEALAPVELVVVPEGQAEHLFVPSLSA